MGRLTLNPLAHIDIFGTIIMPLMLFLFTNGQFVFGYAKPVPIDERNFKNPKRDMAISAAGGPCTNLLLAIISLLLLKYAAVPFARIVPESLGQSIMHPLTLMLTASVWANVVLAAFNMIPIPPLDGGRVLKGVLPYRYAYQLGRIEPYGFFIVLLLIVTHVLDYILVPMIGLIVELLEML